MSNTLSDDQPTTAFAVAAARIYRDERCIEKKCETCNAPFRGPMRYCRLKCAVKDGE
jgi:hypothetical protein